MHSEKYGLTCNLSSTAAWPTGALLPQTGQLRLQHLQPVEDILDVWQLVVTATGLFGDTDAVCENDLIVAIFCVLHVLGVLHVRRGALMFELSASW